MSSSPADSSFEISGKEPEFQLPDKEATLVCNDDIASISGNRFIHEIAAGNADAIAAARPERTREETAEAVREFFHFPAEIAAPHYRVVRCICSKGDNVVSRFALETEPDRIMALLYRLDLKDFYHIPPVSGGKAVLIVPDLDALTELYEREFTPGEEVYAIDPRTIGALMPDGTDQPADRNYYAPYQGEYHYASLGILTGESILGGKIRDILSAVALLKNAGVEEITIEASGNGCVPALFAALLDNSITQLKLNSPHESFAVDAGSPRNRMTLGNVAQGILTVTDIPELKTLLADIIIP